jgi:TonB-dependent SusC/RagA subfamily outer membrane receptor
MMIKRDILIHIFISGMLVLHPGDSFAQEINTCGFVKAYKNYALKGVIVRAVKAGTETTTDSLGQYCIKCNEKDKLVFDAKGFYRKRVRVNAESPVNVSLVFKGGERNKKIATGFGYINEDDLTYAISSYSDKEKDFGQYSSIYNLMQDELPGVEVQDQNVYILGITAWGASPLFVVDGIYQSDISYILPTNIKTINVIKDAAARSMYGPEGMNGVIVIETKKEL